MPVYGFRCRECAEEFDLTRPISKSGDAAECPACGAEAKRLFTPVGVHFKGSGFHNTDYKPKPKEDTGSSCPASTDSGSSSDACKSCPASGASDSTSKPKDAK